MRSRYADIDRDAKIVPMGLAHLRRRSEDTADNPGVELVKERNDVGLFRKRQVRKNLGEGSVTIGFMSLSCAANETKYKSLKLYSTRRKTLGKSVWTKEISLIVNSQVGI